MDFFPNGNILIGNGATHSVKMFDSNGNYIEDFIPNGSGGLITPNAIVIRETNVSSVSGDDNPIKNFVLEQNYPNPFNPSTVISYRLPVTSKVILKVYNILGKEIATLVNEELALCDWSQNQVKRYMPDGNFIDVFTDQGNMQAPNSILFRPVQTTNVENETGSLPDKIELYQNYPNPFNPTTEIKFSLPSVIASETKQSQLVALTVYNLLGKEIATLLDEELTAGEHEVKFDATELPSGIYFYQLKAGDYYRNKKNDLS